MNCFKPIEIICPKHGSFFQVPSDHTKGHGCQKCKVSLGERKTYLFLERNNILYEHNKKFDGCKHIYLLSFDFYISELNLCIEYDDQQYFKPVNHFGSEENLKTIILRDSIKTNYSKNNNINLLRIPFTEFENIENILNDVIIDTKMICEKYQNKTLILKRSLKLELLKNIYI